MVPYARALNRAAPYCRPAPAAVQIVAIRIGSVCFSQTSRFLCSEEDPLDCHRGLMLAPALAALGFAPNHLRRDGSIETNEAMESRLLRETGVGAGLLDGLFAALVTDEDRRMLLAEAYRQMARRKAYRLPEDDDTE